MSLFQAREWWSAASETDEQYDMGSLLIANIDNAHDGNDKIITGSLSGRLRIYAPSSPEQRRSLASSSPSSSTVRPSTNVTSSMNPNDLLLETNLNAPILQLAVGYFQPLLSTTLCLAILHPHKLSVYTVITTTTTTTNVTNNATPSNDRSNEFESKEAYYGTSSSSGSSLASSIPYCRLQRQYEHMFTQPGLHSFSAYNMCYGTFGAAASRTGTNIFTSSSTTVPDAILVQSMDGQVAIYEGTSPGPRRQLDGILLPGPIAYVPRTDTIITTSSDLCLVGFRYSSLLSTSGSTIIRNNNTTTTTNDLASSSSSSSSNVGSTGANGSSSSAKLPLVKPDWSVNLGEITSYLHVGRFDKQTLDQLNLSSLSNPSSTLLAPVDLLVIGDRTFFNMRDNGNSANNYNSSVSSASKVGNTSTSTTPSSASTLTTGNNSGTVPNGAMRIPPSSFASTAPIRSQKRLEYIPIASCLIPRNGTSSSLPHLGKLGVGTSSTSTTTDSGNSASSSSSSSSSSGTAPPSGHNLMVCSANGTLYVYREDTVIWSAKFTSFVPVAIGIGKFGNQAGLTVCLSDRGDICINFMGTDPPTGSLVNGNGADALTTGSRALDYNQMENEYKRLLNVIRDAAVSRELTLAKDTLSFPLVNVPTTVDPLPRHSNATCSQGAGIINGSYGSIWYAPEDVVFETIDAVTGMEKDEGNSSPNDISSLSSSSSSSSPETTNQPSVITTVRIGIAWSGLKALPNVQLTVQPPSWIRLPRGLRTFTIPSVPGKGEVINNNNTFTNSSNGSNDEKDNSVLTLLLPLQARNDTIPSDTKCTLLATYTGEGGETRSHSITFHVPFCLACQVIPPVKTANFKCTLDTNRGPVPLSSLFPDMLNQPSYLVSNETINRVQSNVSSVISFKYNNRTNENVTILLSKSNGRYRLQGSSMEAVTLVAYTLAERLNSYWDSQQGPGTLALQQQIQEFTVRNNNSTGGINNRNTTLPPELQLAQTQLASPFTISYSETLPQNELFEAIDQHLSNRQNFYQAYSTLNDRTHEYRLITKRLLVRFKDRTPAPLHYLDVLMERSHALVLEATENVLRYQEGIGQASTILGARLRLFLLLLQYATGIDKVSIDILRAYLNPENITDTLEYGWEETTDNALTYLLRNGMRMNGIPLRNNNTGNDNGTTTATTTEFNGPPPDSNKLRKHITILVDRLLKGATLIPSLG